MHCAYRDIFVVHHAAVLVENYAVGNLLIVLSNAGLHTITLSKRGGTINTSAYDHLTVDTKNDQVFKSNGLLSLRIEFLLCRSFFAHFFQFLQINSFASLSY